MTSAMRPRSREDSKSRQSDEESVSTASRTVSGLASAFIACTSTLHAESEARAAREPSGLDLGVKWPRVAVRAGLDVPPAAGIERSPRRAAMRALARFV